MKNFLEKITDELYLVKGENRGKFPYSHGLLIDSTQKVLVDTGFGSNRVKAIKSSLDIDIVISTHYHLDHTRGNSHFPEAEFWAHHLDAPAISSSEVFFEVSGLGQVSEIPECYHHYPAVKKISRNLSDGDILDFGGITLEVVHTPGHTPGHICLYEPQQRILFSADIDLTPFGPWYGNPNSNIDDFSSSIDRIIKLNPSVLVSSHGGIISKAITDKLREYQSKITSRENAILDLLKTERKLNDIVNENIIFPPDQPETNQLFEKIMLEKHLSKLANEGKLLLRST